MTKKHIPLLFFAILYFLSSCGNDEIYSCDPQLNEWIHANKSDLAKQTLDELTKSHTYSVQSSIFSSFSASKKQQLWLQKYDRILQHTNLNENEKLHILKLRRFVETDSQIFEGKVFTNEQLDYLDKWKAEGISRFSWTEWDLIYFGTTLYSTQEERTNVKQIFEDELKGIKQTQKSARMMSSECSCNQQMSGCNIMHSCAPSSCKNTSSGCGWFLQQACNGECFT